MSIAELIATVGKQADEAGLGTDVRNRILLALFARYYCGLPKQRTDEWREQRKSVVGGSEITKLMHNGVHTLLRQKRYGFAGNTATRWGTLFEPVACDIVKRISGADICLEMGSIPGIWDDSGKPIMMYSPDRVMIMTRDQLMKLIYYPNNCIKNNPEKVKRFMKKLPEKASYIVLIEIKCPYSRTLGDRVFREYVHQPNSGMMCIPICDCYIYVECKFKRGLAGVDYCGTIDFQPKPEVTLDKTLQEFDAGRIKPVYRFVSKSASPTPSLGIDSGIGLDELIKKMTDLGTGSYLEWGLEVINIVPGMPKPDLFDTYRSKCIEYQSQLSEPTCKIDIPIDEVV
jgi:hypothetical protein